MMRGYADVSEKKITIDYEDYLKIKKESNLYQKLIDKIPKYYVTVRQHWFLDFEDDKQEIIIAQRDYGYAFGIHQTLFFDDINEFTKLLQKYVTVREDADARQREEDDNE